ncbi:MAG: hypothetical protein RMX68_033700 [Aulosira sp. ZfuVER01]|nr:hypothetical protein [Aulosira sp. DedVER01a]
MSMIFLLQLAEIDPVAVKLKMSAKPELILRSAIVLQMRAV